jgi:hypothetical protein
VILHRAGHLIVTLRPGAAPGHVPNHLDVLIGAGRPAGRVDGGRLDLVLRRWGNGFRAALVYHARRSLGRAGYQHYGFDDVEEGLGLSRTYRVQLGEAERTVDALEAVRDLPQVESAAAETLATVPFAAPAAPPARRQTREDAWAPRRQVRAPEALRLEPGDERVRVAVVDTGLPLGHPEFQRKLLAGFNTVHLGMGYVTPQVRLVGDSWGRDFTPLDGVGHGAHVGGVIGAHGWRLPPGAAGLSLLLPVRVLAAARDVTRPHSKPMGVGSLPDIDAGLKVAVDLGADVINASFGTPASGLDPHAPEPHARVVRYADHYGCAVVAAAGNGGGRERFYPAALDGVIAVGSVDGRGRRSAFSSYGDHLALCAPGEDIVSVGRRGYQVSTGTSHAAPFVTAAAALLISRARRAGHKLRPAAVKRLLKGSAVPLAPGGFSPETGHGLLDVLGALRALDRTLEESQGQRQ